MATALTGPSIRAMHTDAEGRLWVGTYGAGLWLVSDTAAQQITTADGLPENVVSWIGEDASGFLWLSGNRGVHRVSRAALMGRITRTISRLASLSITTTASGDPLETNGSAQPAGAWHPDGTLLIPTIFGPMVIDPARLVLSQHGPAIQIDAVSVDLQEADLAAPVVVPIGARRLEVHFSAIEFDHPTGLIYEYRLLPYDDTWQPGGMGRGVYTELPPGRYTFEARAINDRGIASAHPVTLTVVVEPRFTQTTGFLVLVAVLLVGSTILLAWLWSGVARRRARALKQQVDAAIAELKVIRGLLPICAWCRKVRSTAGGWSQLEQYIAEHTEAQVTHGICESCSANLFEGEPGGTAGGSPG